MWLAIINSVTFQAFNINPELESHEYNNTAIRSAPSRSDVISWPNENLLLHLGSAESAAVAASAAAWHPQMARRRQKRHLATPCHTPCCLTAPLPHCLAVCSLPSAFCRLLSVALSSCQSNVSNVSSCLRLLFLLHAAAAAHYMWPRESRHWRFIIINKRLRKYKWQVRRSFCFSLRHTLCTKVRRAILVCWFWVN